MTIFIKTIILYRQSELPRSVEEVNFAHYSIVHYSIHSVFDTII